MKTEAFETINPATGEKLERYPLATSSEIDQVLELSSKAQKAWARRPLDERLAVLGKIAGLFEIAPGFYQLRGFDLSNMHVVEGERGIVVIDPLISAETAAAAWRALPRTLRFAADSARRGRPRASLVTTALAQLRGIEDDLRSQGIGAAAEARTP